MDSFPWLPVGYDLGHGTLVGRVIREGPGYQLLRSNDGTRSALLVDPESLAAKAALAIVPDGIPLFSEIAFGSRQYLAATFDVEWEPMRVDDIARRPRFLTGLVAASLSQALSELSRAAPDASWGEAVFMPSVNACLPTVSTDDEDKAQLAVRLLTGGIADAGLSPRQIRAANPWLTEAEIEAFIATLVGQRPARESTRPVAEFRLPGRPQLEAFLRDYVIEHHRQRDRYEAMGVKAPNGILLWGPPGSGKTFAIRKLVEFLGWPMFDLDLGRIGSPYIHQTGVLLSKSFEEAARAAPSIVLFEELDAIGGGRTAMTHDHKIEELSELLRLVESASEKGILVVATTNRRAALDDALMRKGRFDHCIEVGYPGPEEAAAVLEALISDRPHAPGMNVEAASSKLAGRPISDIAWAVNEAARTAVKANKEAIDDLCLFGAISRLPN